MVGALLKQVIYARTSEFDDIIQKLQAIKDDKNQVLKLDTVCQFLAEALRKCEVSYLCIDALDECQDQTAFLLSVNSLVEHPRLKDSLRLFLTGRPPVENIVKDHVQAVGSDLCSFTLKANTDDIVKYIESQIEYDRSGVSMSASFKEEIIKAIVATSDGMLVIPI
jgi:hypothetical protein